VKRSYYEVLESQFGKKTFKELEEFVKLEKGAVLFHGIGKYSVIAIVNDSSNYLSLPSSDVIIGKRSANRVEGSD
jgi:hypothetical protein